MILIADSGSTKTSWCLTGKNKSTEYYSTSGINPFFRSSDDIETELRESLKPKIKFEVSQIYFYGAGIINEEKGNVVKLALGKLFPQAGIEVFSDLLAAAHATLGETKGIACILGTGSNSCLFDGEKIIEHVPPLGFILGDEGSGAVLGRKILGDYLKGIMPKNIAEKFRNEFNFDYATYLESVYKKEKPNQFLAQFVPFLYENKNDDYCTTLIRNSFDEFIKRNLIQYSGSTKLPICFVGSVAYYFQDELKKVLEKNQLQLKSILKEPLEGLIKFYTQK
jgi:N-acetylglucosamine kinase-like BadF-type ATPase